MRRALVVLIASWAGAGSILLAHACSPAPLCVVSGDASVCPQGHDASDGALGDGMGVGDLPRSPRVQ